MEASYKTVRYSGKERDETGLYYYGYRYYQPWAGRWLSADPAGTVDGLNLFRMCRNNPIKLRDGDGLKPIIENFREDNGDLVYGLKGSRGPYIRAVMEPSLNSFSLDYQEELAPVIDRYNRSVATSALHDASLKTLQNLEHFPEKYIKKIVIPSNIKDLVKKKYNYPLWDNYFQVGENNPKFSITSIYKETGKYPGKSQYHVWDKKGRAPLFLWKRGSKLGIEMAASGVGNKIHFVLDGLNISNIVNKDGAEGQSITASELRYIYRNRERLAGKIHFYNGNAEVSAPWDTDTKLWASYDPKSKCGRHEPTQIITQRRKGGTLMRNILSKLNF